MNSHVDPLPSSVPETSRRTVLLSVLGCFLAACGATFLGPLFAFLSPKKPKGGKQVLVGVDEKPIPSKDLESKPFLLGWGLNGEPTIVMRYSGELLACSAVCTHLGCLVKWDGAKGEFVCPCHAGRFDAHGINIAGPPPKPLKRFRANISADGSIGLEEATA